MTMARPLRLLSGKKINCFSAGCGSCGGGGGGSGGGSSGDVFLEENVRRRRWSSYSRIGCDDVNGNQLGSRLSMPYLELVLGSLDPKGCWEGVEALNSRYPYLLKRLLK